MNIELDEVVVQDVSDDALEQAAGFGPWLKSGYFGSTCCGGAA